MAQYEHQTQEAILQRMLDATSDDVDKRQGSVVYDMLSPAAIELALAYIELDNNLRFGFADEAYGEYLDRRADELGLTRKPATKSTGTLTFSGTDGTVIGIGTRVSTDEENPKYFVTTEQGSVTGGTVSVAAESEEVGKDQNVAAGTITLVIGDLAGVTSVTNNLAFENGVDQETDDELRSRYLDRASVPSTSGNANHYRQWALEIAGIGDAKVFPVWNGNGTVKVVVIDTNKQAPSASKITEVADYIETVRPIGATVTVAAATEVNINVSATLTLEAGYTITDVQTGIEQGITDYLTSLAFVDNVVRYSKIANVILDTEGVIDYSGLNVNGGTANITVQDEEVAVKGTVTLS